MIFVGVVISFLVRGAIRRVIFRRMLLDWPSQKCFLKNAYFRATVLKNLPIVPHSLSRHNCQSIF
ncbi:MAG: hypothetical protein ACXAC8_18180 [Candidatus Hodarchaeales archaeon]